VVRWLRVELLPLALVAIERFVVLEFVPGFGSQLWLGCIAAELLAVLAPQL